MLKKLITVALSILLVACSSTNSTTETSKEETQPIETIETVEEDYTIVLGQPIVFEDFTITIQSFELIKNYEGNEIL
ncbi:MAG: hypothetical protein GX675_02795 [Erysipelotrichaceae bacterium]|nr:hypothetical protein [Erysipelotrichaceae bacterium]